MTAPAIRNSLKTYYSTMLLLLFMTLPAMADEGAAELMALMEGEFRTADPDNLLEGEPLLWDRRKVVDLPGIGATGVYWQLQTGAEEKMYRQLILTFVPNDDGSLTQETWTMDDPAAAANQFDNPAFFAALTSDNLRPTLPEGCAQIWAKDEQSWRGVVDPATCRLYSERREQWRRIGADHRVFPDALWQVERGFDDEMNQQFGTPPDVYYKLRKLADSP